AGDILDSRRSGVQAFRPSGPNQSDAEWPSSSPDPERLNARTPERLTIATGLLALGNWGGGDADKEKLLTDIADDQVDVVSRAFLGLTVACARCHDHKFDPIPTDDYYSLAGIFFSSHILQDPGPKTDGPPMLRIPLVPKPEFERHQQLEAQIAALQKQVKQAGNEQAAVLVLGLLPATIHSLAAAWEYQHQGARLRPMQ